MGLLDKLNKEQKKAAQHVDGPLLILAGAGSGKTGVLTHRIAYLIENGVSPFQILAITFTNKASKEMRARVNLLSPGGESVWVSTFHSLCVRILRRYINRAGFDNNFTIYDSDDSEKLIKRCIKELNLNDKQYTSRAVMSRISNYKNELLTPSMVAADISKDFRETQISNVYTLYAQKLRGNNALDFDDIIMRTVELFTSCPDVLQSYQNRFLYIMVDEYQDTNHAQYQLVNLLAKEHGNLCVVGDDDQSIYGWRGANIRNILDFERDHKKTKVVKLEQNYRSTQNILDAANAVIKNNRNRTDKALWTEEKDGSPLFYYKAPFDYEEANFVTEKIKEVLEDGGKYSDCAVLYRTNAQSRTIEEQLVSKNIPYRIFGGTRFYDRKEVKDVLAYLRVINNPRDGVSLNRIINVPRRGIGDATTDRLNEFATKTDISLYNALLDVETIAEIGSRAKKLIEFRQLMISFMDFAETHTVFEVLNKVLEETNYVGELMVEGTDEAMTRIENVQELLTKVMEFQESAEEPTLTAFLEELALVADIDNYAEETETVVLMTLHSSKGLEFDTVFIVGLEEGIFPSYRSVIAGDAKEIEEERRLCYVGITRAKKTLFMCSATSRRTNGQIVYNNPSRFLKEIPQELIKTVVFETKDKEKKERSGISQFAEVNKVKNAIDISFGGKSYQDAKKSVAAETTSLDFVVGDSVRQMKYGVGIVTEITKAGPDYEVTVEFAGIGVKKFMAHLSRLKKA